MPERSPGAARADPAKREDEAPWIILVARDQPDLFRHLAQAFAGDDKIEIIVDRRKDLRRNPPGVEERLRIHGAAVVKRPRR
jgi:hypothetical protein